jgi:hypothetical protein
MRINYIVLLLVLVGLATSASAQHYNLAVGPEINLPSGNASNISTIGFAGAVKAEIGLTRKFAVTANGSLTTFLGRKYFGTVSSAETAIPIKAGFKYYNSENFYFEGQAGTSIPINGQLRNSFVWSAGLGSYLKLNYTENKLDVGLRYEGWSSKRNITPNNTSFSTFGFISLRAAYAFNL